MTFTVILNEIPRAPLEYTIVAAAVTLTGCGVTSTVFLNEIPRAPQECTTEIALFH